MPPKPVAPKRKRGQKAQPKRAKQSRAAFLSKRFSGTTLPMHDNATRGTIEIMSTPSQRPAVNRQFLLASRPVGKPKESDFKMVDAPIPELKDGQVLVRALYLSVDPYMRGRISGMK